MKKIAIFTAAISFLFPFANLFPESRATAKTLDTVKVHKAKSGETVKEIAVKYGVPAQEIKESNDDGNTKLLKGEKVIVPESVSLQEKELLARLVQAEAKGEPFEGKVAVAAVVLNRVKSDKFPDTIKQVIYQKRQFQPVDNGMINKPAGPDAKKAVNEAIAKDGEVTKALFFFNPHKIKQSWLYSRPAIKDIGNHRFTM